MSPTQFYCVYCGKKHTVPVDTLCVRKTSNGQAQLVGQCQKSKADVYKFIKQSSYATAVKKYGKC